MQCFIDRTIEEEWERVQKPISVSVLQEAVFRDFPMWLQFEPDDLS
jgi:hypothetical protein